MSRLRPVENYRGYTPVLVGCFALAIVWIVFLAYGNYRQDETDRQFDKFAILHSTDEAGYRLTGLPCSTRILVFGAVSKDGGKYTFSAFDWHGKKQPVMIKIEPGQPFADQAGSLEQK